MSPKRLVEVLALRIMGGGIERTPQMVTLFGNRVIVEVIS